jgi:hypothetical protein
MITGAAAIQQLESGMFSAPAYESECKNDILPDPWMGTISANQLKLEPGLGEMRQAHHKLWTHRDPFVVLWDRSHQQRLCVKNYVFEGNNNMYTPNPNIPPFYLPCSAFRIQSAHEEVFRDSELLFLMDTHFHAHCGNALVIEPGLSSFVWPMSTDTFLTDFYAKKAFVAHASRHRLSSLREDFLDFNAEELILDASRVVVWMKTTGEKKEMQYIDANAEVGLNCYKAGHSVYFNPSLEVQKKYLSALTGDLLADFAARKEPGSHNAQDGLGGDIEMFAVQGQHSTPWHFDAQENFTVQMTGYKKWSLAPPTAPNPVTNLHPKSSNRLSVRNGLKVNHAYATPERHLAADGPDLSEAESFILRPGSILYAPGGFWHKVDTVGSGPSLSMNFSVDTARWIDVFLPRFIQHLYGSDPRWRQRVMVTSVDECKATYDSLVQTVSQVPRAMGSDRVLFPAVFDENRQETLMLDAKRPVADSDNGNGNAGDELVSLHRGLTRRQLRVIETTRGQFVEQHGVMGMRQKSLSELNLALNPMVTVIQVDDGEGVAPSCSHTAGSEKQHMLSEKGCADISCAFCWCRYELHSGFGGNADFHSDFKASLTLSRTAQFALVMQSVMGYTQHRVTKGSAWGEALTKLLIEERLQGGHVSEVEELCYVLLHNGVLIAK